jgi:hypothetical protein
VGGGTVPTQAQCERAEAILEEALEASCIQAKRGTLLGQIPGFQGAVDWIRDEKGVDASTDGCKTVQDFLNALAGLL